MYHGFPMDIPVFSTFFFMVFVPSKGSPCRTSRAADSSPAPWGGSRVLPSSSWTTPTRRLVYHRLGYNYIIRLFYTLCTDYIYIIYIYIYNIHTCILCIIYTNMYIYNSIRTCIYIYTGYLLYVGMYIYLYIYIYMYIHT